MRRLPATTTTQPPPTRGGLCSDAFVLTLASGESWRTPFHTLWRSLGNRLADTILSPIEPDEQRLVPGDGELQPTIQNEPKRNLRAETLPLVRPRTTCCPMGGRTSTSTAAPPPAFLGAQGKTISTRISTSTTAACHMRNQFYLQAERSRRTFSRPCREVWFRPKSGHA